MKSSKNGKKKVYNSHCITSYIDMYSIRSRKYSQFEEESNVFVVFLFPKEHGNFEDAS